MRDSDPSEALDTLDALARDQLIEKWQSILGTRPAKNLSSVMMRRILAYELQCKLRGKLSPAARRALSIKTVKASGLPVANNADDKTVEPSDVITMPKTSPLLSSGTYLVREWNGRAYRVEILDEGFQMDGKIYRSLSAIAKKITGAHWSGPRFFGLKAS